MELLLSKQLSGIIQFVKKPYNLENTCIVEQKDKNNA